jgi:GH15 family glucan-1,4-alpha-glucosidase
VLIEDYALIGDLHTAALVSRNGSIDWLCFPRFDSGACFAALLGDERNGHWTIAPMVGGPATRRRYRDDTLILESEWDTPEGTVRVIDLMPPRDRLPDVVRIVEGVSGSVPVRSTLRFRLDYGHVIPWVRRLDGQLGAIAGPDSIWLRTPVKTFGEDFTTYAEFTVRAGDRVPFVLTWQPSHLRAPRPVAPEQALVDTEQYWRSWVDACTYQGEWRDAVIRSLITLKALTYQPTGGIVAAATTSLPEELGGVRNWDYRYCWLRDSTMTLHALMANGYTQEAKEWREWLVRAIAGSPADMQIMYGVAGERRLMEYELDWLPGYAGSKPVRVGNAAVDQFQLDVYGEVMDTLHAAREENLAPEAAAWNMQKGIMDFLEGAWRDPDNGLWEMRGPRQHFTYSKVMAWVAFDRAVATLRSSRHLQGPIARWEAICDEIHDEVCEKAYDPELGSFVQAYGSKELDASLLLIPQLGFLPPTDKRVIGTVEAVEQTLMSNGFVHRYRTEGECAGMDGLPGGEGAFLACTFWLADALCMIGRHREAHETFERLLDLRNDVGLLSEEYDPVRQRQLGNVPQAFTHVPLVNTARNLSAEESPCRKRSKRPTSGQRRLA